jgi:RNA polymerase sigma factor (TIGR02999 family)
MATAAATRNITRALGAFDRENPQTGDQLFNLVYGELRHIAERLLSRFAKVQGTLSPENLISELYIRLCRRESLAFPSRADFYQYCCGVMRNLITDYARKKRYKVQFVSEDWLQNELGFAHVMGEDELKQLDDFLDRLKRDPDTARIASAAELRFEGMERKEIAGLLGVVERTITRDLAAFRAAWEAYRNT